MKVFRLFTPKKGLLFTLSVALLLSLVSRYGGFWQEEELRWFDRFTQRYPKDTPERIVIVTITDKDIQKFPSFIPDDLSLAKTIKIIAQQQPRAIGIDLIRDRPVPPGKEELEKVFCQTSNVYGIGKFTGIENDAFFSKISPPYMMENHECRDFDEDNLSKVGDVSVVVDEDGVIRRANLYPTTGDAAIESLGLLLARKYLRKEKITAQPGLNNRLKLGTVEFPIFEENAGGYIQADDGGYQSLMRWTTPLQKFKQVSLSDVLDKQISSNFFKDKIVLIGYWTTTLKRDLFYTPFSYVPNGKTPRQAFGVEIQASFAQYILTTVLDELPALKSIPEVVEVIWVAIWGVSCSLVIWRIRDLHLLKAPWVLIGTGVIILSLFIIISTEIHFWLFKWGWWLPLAATNSSLVIFMVFVLFFIFRERIRVHLETLEQKVNERTVSLTEALETIKQNQEQLIKQEKLAFLGRLTAGFCHQFKNPLYQLKYGLSTGIALFNSTDKSSISEEQREAIEFLKSLEEPIEKLELIFKLILLSPSQKKVSYLTVSPNLFVDSILKSVLKYHLDSVLASQVKISYDQALAQKLSIPQQLEIPLFNIIENACDVLAQKQRKEINFIPKLIIKTEVRETYWSVSIKDNGEGLDSSIEDKLFQPFVTTKAEVQGIGLGLYISHEIMEQIGGEILVQSTTQGVKFVLKIPFRKKTVA